MKNLRYYFFLWLHIVFLALWYSSPWYLDWRIIIGTVILYHLQMHFAKGCLLTLGQFGRNNEGFYYHYLRTLGFRPNKKHLNFVLDFIIPGTMIIVAMFLQGVL